MEQQYKAIVGGSRSRLKFKMGLLLLVLVVVLAGLGVGGYALLHHSKTTAQKGAAAAANSAGSTTSTSPTSSAGSNTTKAPAAGTKLDGGTTSTKQTTTTTTTTPPKTGASVNNDVVTTLSYQYLGQYLADPGQNALYTYGGDKSGVSNCTGSCIASWPVYKATSSTGLPTNVSVITRGDGTLQYAYKGLPLYYYSGDGPGEVSGDGLSNFSIARP